MSRRRHRPSAGANPMLDLLADALDGLHRSRSTVDRHQQPDDFAETPKHSPQQGDFLMDFARLNIQYVNQLARLGSNYSVVAARALERFYDYFQPNVGEPEPEITLLEGRTDDRVVFRATVDNCTDEDASYRVSVTTFKLEDADDHTDGSDREERIRRGLLEELEPHYQHPKRSRASSIHFSLEEGESEEIRLGLRISKSMVIGAEYWGKLVVRRRKTDEYDEEIEQHPIVLRRFR